MIAMIVIRTCSTLPAVAAMCVCLATRASSEGPCGAAGTVAVNHALTFVKDAKHLVVRVLDPDLTGDPNAIRKLDAFIVRERDGSIRQVIYLNCESNLFKAAADGSDFYVKVLAAVIQHEATHLEGRDEASAAAAEREFFLGLIRSGLVPAREGVAYLDLMKHAHGVQ